MKKAEKKKKTGSVEIMISAAVVMFVMLVLLCTAIAGDLEPSSAPAPTMHTLDDIYNKASAQSLPDTDTLTFVTKSQRTYGSYDWQTIHTVAQGKDFFLMGATCITSPVNGLAACDISSHPGELEFKLPHNQTISASYPIGRLYSGNEINVKGSGSGENYITIFGYERRQTI